MRVDWIRCAFLTERSAECHPARRVSTSPIRSHREDSRSRTVASKISAAKNNPIRVVDVLPNVAGHVPNDFAVGEFELALVGARGTRTGE